MKDRGNAPKKLRSLLILCLAGVLISTGITFLVYRVSKTTLLSLGRDTVPSIVAAQNIKATLADAHSNAMNAMVTKEKLGEKFWDFYRKDMNLLHSQLVDVSRNITYGNEEREPILAISSNIGAYEYTVGGAVANGAEISVDQFMEANRLMQQRILPASTALSKVNLSQLDSIYNNYLKSINILLGVMILAGVIFMGIIIYTQVHVFKSTHRILNAGLLAGTILFLVNIIYSANALVSVKTDLYSAKHDAFTSINALWNARSTAYNAKSIESLYLLHEGTGIVQTADTINFNLSASRICSDPEAALSGENFSGFLSDTLKNIAFKEEEPVLKEALSRWAKYVELDREVHSLEYDSRHKEAITLSTGSREGQSDYEFKSFDEALGKGIGINQENFDLSINSAFKTLKIFPYITAAFLILISGACIFGMKARMDEYKV